MKVTDVLLEGRITKPVFTLLNLLKATLLLKYFPDDSKHKKKHDKFLKEKKKLKFEDQEISSEQPRSEGVDFGEIRRKTVVKLERIFQKAGISDRAQGLAQQVELWFQETADSTGQKYNEIAYERMRAIKGKMIEFADKHTPVPQIKDHL